MSVKTTAHSSRKNSRAMPKRHSDSSDRMLAAVAAASPETTILPRTKASSKMPRTMMMRYSRPPSLARTWGEASTWRSSISTPSRRLSYVQRAKILPAPGAAESAMKSASGSSFRFGESLSFQPVVELVDPVVAARALVAHAEAVAAGAEDVDLGLVARRSERLMELDDGGEGHGVVLRPGEKHGRQLRRDDRHDAERAAVDQGSEARARRGVRLEQGSAGYHGPGREAEESDPVGREAPFRRVLPHHLDGLNSVGDPIPAGGVHVHIRNAFLPLFQDPILEHEGGDGPFLQPARDIAAFQIDGQRDESAAGSDDDAGPRGLRSLRKIGRQRRRHDVEDHRSERSVLDRPFLLGPTLGTGSGAGPDIYDLRLTGAKCEDDSGRGQQDRSPHISS